VLEILNNIFNTFSAPVFVPVILFFIALILRVDTKKAFFSALYAGIGLEGFTLLLNSYVPIVVPVVQKMVTNTGVNLPIFDIGWQAASVVAYSTTVGMIFLGLGIVLQLALFLVRWTDIFQPSDLWNNYSYMAWGSMIYLITKNMMLSILCMVVLNLYSLLFSEIVAKRWSKYYNYPNCTIIQLHHVETVPFAILMNWILSKLGADKIKLDPPTLQKKLGFIGEPITLGLLLGLLIGILGNLSSLGTLAAWGQIAICGISTSAVMAIFPRIAGLFAQAFLPLTEATKKSVKGATKAREWYLGVNDATGYGETATLTTGIILIPIMVLLAIILPGNRTLPLVDLIALPYMVEVFVAMSNGNMFKSIISGAIWFSIGLYITTFTAPFFTQVAAQVGVSIPETALMITSFGILAKPLVSLIFLAFLSQSWLLIGIVLAIYFVIFFYFKRNKSVIYNYIERSAVGNDESEGDLNTANS
jgi:PTS system sugar-specific permease component.